VLLRRQGGAALTERYRRVIAQAMRVLGPLWQ
jgi:hypothetical protein